MAHLLITGGAGFIGGAIAHTALAAGHTVRILDNLREDVHPGQVFIADGVEFIQGDVTDGLAVREALTGVDAVLHQAAKVGLGVDFNDTPDYVSTNDVGTAVLLTEMARQGIHRLVLASSMVVYGEGHYQNDLGKAVAVLPRLRADLDRGMFEPVDTATGLPLTPVFIDEEAVPDPRNVYAATKLQQEHLATIWANNTDSVVARLRYHNVYGPHMPKNTPYAGVASLFRSQIARGEAPTVYEDGGQRRDFIHVNDVARVNMAALNWTAHQIAGTSRAFNVASSEVHTILDMARAIARHAKAPEPVVTGRYRLGDVRHITASAARLQRELGPLTMMPFEVGMQAFATAPQRDATMAGGS